ncbi:helix-turn-helix transcriptional regulator [Prauserella alba]|uniref:Helix-turn-helix transcriptional regulator n=1 Tax=Prauserella alba TaxID=176898 RepID=A0ABP4FNJ1_9PSEU|nr:helix-turn-helix transcriptional regulator [Prauserella alba]MCP2180225.1 Helix-turn-helix domain-containing protein [Prauserella alba]
MATSSEELGVFLKSRRACVTPAEVGLPPGTRRRVPGLRREEVAVLANVGTTWYTWLEQGRRVQPSITVLGSIADALLLSHAERAHLFRLAGYTAAADHAGESAISDRLRTTLDQLSPFPAMVTDSQYFLRAYNQSYRYLVHDIESYAPQDRNNVLLTLADPHWRAAFVNVDDYAAALVARTRGVYGTTLTDPAWPPLLERLRAVPRFAQLWDSGAVGVESRCQPQIRNPHVGTLSLQTLGFTVAENTRLTLRVFQPADTTTQSRLETLQNLIESGRIETGQQARRHLTPVAADDGGHGAAG